MRGLDRDPQITVLDGPVEVAQHDGDASTTDAGPDAPAYGVWTASNGDMWTMLFGQGVMRRVKR